MAHLSELRRLRRDPAAFSAPNAGADEADGAQEIDPSSHTFSPSIRMQQKEVAAKFAEAEELALKSKGEFEERYAEGFAHWQAGDADAALEQFAAAYLLSREMNYRAGEADALNMTGVCYKLKGDLERAAGVFEGAANLCKGMRDAPGEAAALGNLGQALAAQRRLGEAETAHERSLALAKGASDASCELSALFHLGTLRLRSHRFREAEAALSAAQAIAQANQDVAAEVGVLQRLAAARDARQRVEPPQPPELPLATSPRADAPTPDDDAASSHRGARTAPSGARAAEGCSCTASGSSPGGRSSSAGAGGGGGGGRRPQRSRFVISPNAELSASLQQRNLAVEPPSSAQPPPEPLPPLEPPPATPLQLLERAESLARSIADGGPLRMQVLRQLRAQYSQLRDDERVKECERAIDALHIDLQAPPPPPPPKQSGADGVLV